MRAGGAAHELSLADFEGVGVYHRSSDDTDASLAAFGGHQAPARSLQMTSLPMVGTASRAEAPVADWGLVPFAPMGVGELRGFGAVGAYEEGAPPWLAPTIAGAGLLLLLGAAKYKGYF